MNFVGYDSIYRITDVGVSKDPVLGPLLFLKQANDLQNRFSVYILNFQVT